MPGNFDENLFVVERFLQKFITTIITIEQLKNYLVNIFQFTVSNFVSSEVRMSFIGDVV